MALKLQLMSAAVLGITFLAPMRAGWTQAQIIPANSDALWIDDGGIDDEGIDAVAAAEAPSTGAIATEPASKIEAETEIAETEILVQPAAASDVVNYSNRAMSVSFPKEWQVEEIDSGIMVANVTTAPAELVATQIVSIDAPPGAVVNANIDSFVEEGSTVGRYRTVTIDGQSALVMWLSNRPDELTQAIATFIGYGNQTVLLFSRYAPENESAEEKILQMHTSFANLAIQTATAEDPDAEDPDAEDPDAEELDTER